jgi:putative ABC transport system permease protein
MPEWKEEIAKRVAGLHLRPEREAEIIDEVSGHLQDRYEDMRAQGGTHEQAFQDVIAELDATDLVPELQASEETAPYEPVPEGAATSGQVFSDLPQDLRYAMRMLRKTPGLRP